MRVILAVAFAVPAIGAGTAHGATVADVVQDFVPDGRLDGSYDPDLLRRVISDATQGQYGDPLLTQRLRRAARQQIAGVAPQPPPASPPPPAAPQPADPPPAEPPPAEPPPTAPGTTDDGPTSLPPAEDPSATTTAPAPSEVRPPPALPAAVSDAASEPLFSTGETAVAACVLLLLTGGLAWVVARAKRGGG